LYGKQRRKIGEEYFLILGQFEFSLKKEFARVLLLRYTPGSGYLRWQDFSVKRLVKIGKRE
jgi:hypothetical protein